MKRFLTILAALFITLTVNALADNQPTHLRLVHAIPDGPTIDVWLDNQPLFKQVKFTDITDYLPITAQSHTLKVISNDSLLLETTIKTEANQDYTLAIAGKLILLEPVLLKDNNHLPAPGTVQLRLVHLSPNAPTLDMLGKNGVQATLFNEVGFKEAANYIPLHAGKYDFTLHVADTEVEALTTPKMDLADGQVYSLFVMGLAGSKSGLQLISHIDTVTRPAIPTKSKVSPATKVTPIAAAITKNHDTLPIVAEFAKLTHQATAKPPLSVMTKLDPAPIFSLPPDAMPITGADESETTASLPAIEQPIAPEPAVSVVVATTTAPAATMPMLISLLVIISTLMVGAKTLQKDPRQARQRNEK
jgi:hypothetical protein